MSPSQLLGPEDRARIEAAVAEAERGTRGEIVVTIVRACDEYAAAPWRCGVLLALLAALAASMLAPGIAVLPLLAVQAAAMALGHLACRVDAVRRAFVSEAEFERRAQRQAMRAFAEHGLRKTRERTGILIFIALFEHRVVVIGDEAVDAVLDPAESWREIVDLVLAGIRQGRAADGIVAAVRRCGEILARPLPPREDDTDEIPHALVLEE